MPAMYSYVIDCIDDRIAALDRAIDQTRDRIRAQIRLIRAARSDTHRPEMAMEVLRYLVDTHDALRKLRAVEIALRQTLFHGLYVRHLVPSLSCGPPGRRGLDYPHRTPGLG
ncbi:hypothetical protein EPAKOI_004377 [Cupriavidus sp. H18C2]